MTRNFSFCGQKGVTQHPTGKEDAKIVKESTKIDEVTPYVDATIGDLNTVLATKGDIRTKEPLKERPISQIDRGETEDNRTEDKQVEVKNNSETESFASINTTVAGALHVLTEMINEYCENHGYESGYTINDWKTANNSNSEKQISLLEQIKIAQEAFNYLCEGELEAKGEIGSVKTLNSWLAENGFGIQLNPIGEDDVASVAIMDIKVEWEESGEDTKVVLASGRLVKGFKMPFSGNTSIKNLPSSLSNNKLLEIKTKTPGRSVCITKIPSGFRNEQLLDFIAEIEGNRSIIDNDIDRSFDGGSEIPNVKLDVGVDLSLLKGLRIITKDTKPFFLSQIKGQAKLEMDKNGAHASSAVSMATSRFCGIPKKLTIDGPFIFWIKQEGCDAPLTPYVVGEDSMDFTEKTTENYGW